jgi:redox-sensitive bicupin YhaK (pirin superfamily)
LTAAGNREEDAMILIRRSGERGHADHGWLDTFHTFSFADYHDPRFMGFRSLRVINDDRVVPGAGFPTHPHRDMEIVTYVVDGALEHRDSMGMGSVIRPGDIQRMSAGTGVTHSEYNPSKTEGTRLLQIWITPSTTGLEPGYEQRHFEEQERRGRFRLVVSPEGRDGSISVHQDAEIYAALLGAGMAASHELRAGRGAWVQVVNGKVRLGDDEMVEGDGAAVEDEAVLTITAEQDAELLLFDLV